MASKIDFFSVKNCLKAPLLELLPFFSGLLAHLVDAIFFIVLAIYAHVLSAGKRNSVDLVR
jgi:hypothetical protein